MCLLFLSGLIALVMGFLGHNGRMIGVGITLCLIVFDIRILLFIWVVTLPISLLYSRR